MGVSWSPDALMTIPGLVMLSQTAIGLLGGIVNLVAGSFSFGFMTFLFWSSFFISGILSLSHLLNLVQTIQDRFPYFAKVQLGYAVVWGGLFAISVIISFIYSFGITNIFLYLGLVAFGIDLFFKFRNYRQANAESQAGTA